jgi:hypothetical protein
MNHNHLNLLISLKIQQDEKRLTLPSFYNLTYSVSSRRTALPSSDDDPGDHDEENNVDTQAEIHGDDETYPLPWARHPAGFRFIVVQFTCVTQSSMRFYLLMLLNYCEGDKAFNRFNWPKSFL